jgi:ketosteroid isomerase-like protein
MQGLHFTPKLKMMKTTKRFATFIIAWILTCCFPGCTQQQKKEEVLRDYYTAYEKKDWHMLELILADGFTFTSPAGDDHINLALYKQRCWPNANHTRRFDLEKVMIDGEDAFVTYNGWTTDGKLFRNTEHFKFKDGKIKENECFFGTGISFPNNTAK